MDVHKLWQPELRLPHRVQPLQGAKGRGSTRVSAGVSIKGKRKHKSTSHTGACQSRRTNAGSDAGCAPSVYAHVCTTSASANTNTNISASAGTDC